MAVSRRFGLGLFAITLFVAACGDGGGDDKEKDAAPPSTDGGTRGGTGQDGGLIPVIEIADLDDNTAGIPCTEDTACKGKAAYCLGGTCTGVCESNKNCGAGGSCVQPVAGENGLCSKVCKADTECGSGQDCRAGFDVGDFTSIFDDLVADAGIVFDAGIDLRNVPMTCGPTLGVVQLGEGVVGAPCTTDTPCAPGECGTNINFLEQFPNGYCTGKCLKDSDCGAGGVCYKDPLTALSNTEGRCLLGCTAGSTCKHGLACRVSPIIDEKSYCLPAVANASTADGGV
jgi:hypothetical protein